MNVAASGQVPEAQRESAQETGPEGEADLRCTPLCRELERDCPCQASALETRWRGPRATALVHHCLQAASKTAAQAQPFPRGEGDSWRETGSAASPEPLTSSAAGLAYLLLQGHFQSTHCNTKPFPPVGRAYLRGPLNLQERKGRLDT